MKDVIRLILAMTLLGVTIIVYEDFKITGMGIFHRNDCGTYDRWMIWADDPLGPVKVPLFPNGVWGKDSKDCKGVIR